MRLLCIAFNSLRESLHTFNTHKQKTQHKHVHFDSMCEGVELSRLALAIHLTVHQALCIWLRKSLANCSGLTTANKALACTLHAAADAAERVYFKTCYCKQGFGLYAASCC